MNRQRWAGMTLLLSILTLIAWGSVKGCHATADLADDDKEWAEALVEEVVAELRKTTKTVEERAGNVEKKIDTIDGSVTDLTREVKLLRLEFAKLNVNLEALSEALTGRKPGD